MSGNGDTIFGLQRRTADDIAELKQMVIELLHEIRNRTNAPTEVRNRRDDSPPPSRKRSRSRSPRPRESDVEVFIGKYGDVVEKYDVEMWLKKRYGKDCITVFYVHPSNEWAKITMANNHIQTQVLNDSHDLAKAFGWDEKDIKKGKSKVRR